jgi:hypothetical protein
MGRKAKLKRQRHTAPQPQPLEAVAPDRDLSSTEFVQKLQRQGFDFSDLQRAPELPKDERELPL